MAGWLFGFHRTTAVARAANKWMSGQRIKAAAAVLAFMCILFCLCLTVKARLASHFVFFDLFVFLFFFIIFLCYSFSVRIPWLCYGRLFFLFFGMFLKILFVYCIILFYFLVADYSQKSAAAAFQTRSTTLRSVSFCVAMEAAVNDSEQTFQSKPTNHSKNCNIKLFGNCV